MASSSLPGCFDTDSRFMDGDSGGDGALPASPSASAFAAADVVRSPTSAAVAVFPVRKAV